MSVVVWEFDEDLGGTFAMDREVVERVEKSGG